MRTGPLLSFALGLALVCHALPSAAAGPKMGVAEEKSTIQRGANPTAREASPTLTPRRPAESPAAEDTRATESPNALRPARPGIANPARRYGPSGTLSPGDEAVDGSADGLGFAPDPCGDRYAIETIQASPPLDPGEQIHIHGCGFGSNPPGGEVRLLGDFPGGYLKLNRYGWTPHGIIAVVPQVEGVKDMPEARLQVIRHDGTPSNWFDAGGFRAAREAKKIHPQHVGISCGAANAAECNLAKSFPLAEADFFQNASFAAKHQTSIAPKEDCSALEMLGSSHHQGTDAVTIDLKNDWKLTGAWAWSWGKTTGNGTVTGPPSVPSGVSNATLQFDWTAFANACQGPHASGVRYRVEIWAEGPKGVPYH